MTFELTPQTIITTGAVITAAVLLIQRFAKGVRWFDQQEKQTTDIAALKAKHEADMKAMKQILAEDILWDNDPAADFERGEAVTVCQLVSAGAGDPEHRSDLHDGEHQRQLVIACVGGMFHHSLPFLMRRAAYPSRTACAELAAVLLRARPQIVGARERFLWLHGSVGWCSAGCRSS